MGNLFRNVLILSIFAIVFSINACADAGLPMLAIAMPICWFALIPIIGIEWWILKKKLPEISNIRLMISASVSNIISTVAGIPIAWFCMKTIQMAVPGGGGTFPGFHPFWKYFLGVTLQAPWLIPYESQFYWMIPTAFIFLLVPFFLMSCLIEALISIPILKTKSYNFKAIVRAVCRANIWSYAFLLSIGILLLFLGVFELEKISELVVKVIRSISVFIMNGLLYVLKFFKIGNFITKLIF